MAPFRSVDAGWATLRDHGREERAKRCSEHAIHLRPKTSTFCISSLALLPPLLLPRLVRKTSLSRSLRLVSRLLVYQPGPLDALAAGPEDLAPRSRCRDPRVRRLAGRNCWSTAAVWTGACSGRRGTARPVHDNASGGYLVVPPAGFNCGALGMGCFRVGLRAMATVWAEGELGFPGPRGIYRRRVNRGAATPSPSVLASTWRGTPQGRWALVEQWRHTVRSSPALLTASWQQPEHRPASSHLATSFRATIVAPAMEQEDIAAAQRRAGHASEVRSSDIPTCTTTNTWGHKARDVSAKRPDSASPQYMPRRHEGTAPSSRHYAEPPPTHPTSTKLANDASKSALHATFARHGHCATHVERICFCRKSKNNTWRERGHTRPIEQDKASKTKADKEAFCFASHGDRR